MGTVDNHANVTNQTIINIQNMSGGIGISDILKQSEAKKNNGIPSKFNEDYYNLFVFGDEKFYKGTKFNIDDKSYDRVPDEYFKIDDRRKYIKPNEEDISRLKSYLCLFANENHHYLKADPEQVTYLGCITDIKIRDNGINVYFHIFDTLPQEEINRIYGLLGMWGGNSFNELSRTHWRIVEVNLMEELLEAGLISEEKARVILSACLHTEPGADNVAH